MPKDLKHKLEERKKELTAKLEQVYKSLNILENAWTPEVVIRKCNYEMGIPRYSLDRDDKIEVEVHFPNVGIGMFHANPIKYNLDEFTQEFVEFSPKVRKMYQKD